MVALRDGKLEDAVQQFKQAICRADKLDDLAAGQVNVRMLLAIAYAKLKRTQEAESLLLQARDKCRKSLGTSHPYYAAGTLSLGTIWLDKSSTPGRSRT